MSPPNWPPATEGCAWPPRLTTRTSAWPGIAHELAQDGRAISADDVRAALAERHPDIDGCMNWMGSVFRGEE